MCYYYEKDTNYGLYDDPSNKLFPKSNILDWPSHKANHPKRFRVLGVNYVVTLVATGLWVPIFQADLDPTFRIQIILIYLQLYRSLPDWC